MKTGDEKVFPPQAPPFLSIHSDRGRRNGHVLNFTKIDEGYGENTFSLSFLLVRCPRERYLTAEAWRDLRHRQG
jgi:hypothetical protein